MIHIDLLNPQTIDTYTLTESASSVPAPKRRSGLSFSMPSISSLIPTSFSMPAQSQGWVGIVGINVAILLILIILISILPADVGGFIYKTQKVFTRLYNLM